MSMTVPIKAKVPSLFDLHDKHEVHAHGSSITSFCEPHEEGKKGRRVIYENTYKMEPPRKFRPDKVKPIIDHVLQSNLEGKKYDPIAFSILTKQLSEEIKQKVKELNYGRYKIICLVTIGEKREHGVITGSRFLWDADRDNFAASSWSNRNLYAVGTVYAVYYE